MKMININKFILICRITLFIIFLLLSANLSYSQATKKVEKKVDKYEQYEYYVLVSDILVKHGPYKKMGHKKKLEESGYYKNGLKDSIWTVYYYDGSISKTTTFSEGKMNGPFTEYGSHGKILIKGDYVNDEKSGVWEHSTSEGIQFKYDYTTDDLLFFNPDYDLNYITVEDGDTLKQTLDKPCIYLGGLYGLYEHIGKNFFYPDAAKAANKQGKVYVTFMVGTDGKIKDATILRGLGYGLDEEALRIIQSLPDKWSPAVFEGKKIEVRYNIPIVCRLQ